MTEEDPGTLLSQDSRGPEDAYVCAHEFSVTRSGRDPATRIIVHAMVYDARTRCKVSSTEHMVINFVSHLSRKETQTAECGCE